MPLISTRGAASIANFGVGAGGKKINFDPTSLYGYAGFHATDPTQSASSRSLLQSYMTSKGVVTVQSETNHGFTAIPNTYIDSPNTVYILNNNNSFSNQATFEPFPTNQSSTKVILFTFAGNVNTSSGYSKDMPFARQPNRFYSNLNNGNTQTSSNRSNISFIPGNPVVDNMSNISSFSGYGYFNKLNGLDGVTFNQNVGAGFNTEKYSFATYNNLSFAMGVKNLDTNGGLVVINLFFDSIGGGYGGVFDPTAQNQIMDLIYCASVWLTTPP